MGLKFKKGDAARVDMKYASRLPEDIRGRWGEVLYYGKAMRAYLCKFVSPYGNHNTFMMWFSANELNKSDVRPYILPNAQCKFQARDFVRILECNHPSHIDLMGKVGEIWGYDERDDSYVVWFQETPFDDLLIWFKADELRKEG